MHYDKHVFISYSHLDNQPLTPEQQGWVSRFHESLETILTMRLGRKAEIWRDEKKIRGNDRFADEIVDQFPNTGILVSIVSKCYVNSEWCRREFEEFCRRAGELRVGNKYRIVKVVKLPVNSSLPPPMNEMTGYEFFTYKDKDSEHPLELDPVYFPKLAPVYIEKLYVLADDVIDLIKRMEVPADDAPAAAPEASSRPKVFLAQCSRDQKEAREALGMDLKQHGYTVLPDRPLPTEEAEFVAEVARYLDQCSLAVQLVGGFPGFVPDGPSGKSAVVLQNELAIEQSKKRKMPRVVWLPAGTESRDSDHQRFIEALHGRAEAQLGAELIPDDLEKLKEQIHAILERIDKASTQTSAAEDPDQNLIYLICDKEDREDVLPLRKLLKGKGYDVKIPLFAGTAAEVDAKEREMLTRCKAALIFYGKGDEGWKNAMDGDLMKSKAYRVDKAPFVHLTYLAPPVTEEKKEMLELQEPNLVDGLEGLSQSVIEALSQILQKA